MRESYASDRIELGIKLLGVESINIKFSFLSRNVYRRLTFRAYSYGVFHVRAYYGLLRVGVYRLTERYAVYYLFVQLLSTRR